MIEIGKYNQLKYTEKVGMGIILSDGEESAILPYGYVPDDFNPGDLIDVFVYSQADGLLFATTQTAIACVEEFAFLEVVDENEQGVFMDLGVDKDVFVPKKEQKHPMDLGEKYVVYIYLDDHGNRLLASSRLNNFIGELDADLEEGDEVALLISEKTDLGYNAIINNKYIGLLYHNEIYETLQPGDKRRGYIKKIREENKIDLSLQPIGFDHILQLRNSLIQVLKDNNGVLPLGDKSSPEEIQQKLKISKKAFKKAIGGLYKERLITLSDHEIRLLQS